MLLLGGLHHSKPARRQPRGPAARTRMSARARGEQKLEQKKQEANNQSENEVALCVATIIQKKKKGRARRASGRFLLFNS